MFTIFFIRCHHQQSKLAEQKYQHRNFAEDIILMVYNPQELEEMLNAIHTMSQPLGKNKVMFNRHVKPSPVIVYGKCIE